LAFSAFGDSAVVNQWLKANADLSTVGEHITDSDYFGTGPAALRTCRTWQARRHATP
jgi:hypothetical protein